MNIQSAPCGLLRPPRAPKLARFGRALRWEAASKCLRGVTLAVASGGRSPDRKLENRSETRDERAALGADAGLEFQPVGCSSFGATQMAARFHMANLCAFSHSVAGRKLIFSSAPEQCTGTFGASGKVTNTVVFCSVAQLSRRRLSTVSFGGCSRGDAAGLKQVSALQLTAGFGPRGAR